MKLFEAGIGTRDIDNRIKQYFRKMFIPFDSLFTSYDNNTISEQNWDRFYDPLITSIESKLGPDLYFPVEYRKELDEAIKRKRAQKITELLNKYTTTFDDWVNSTDAEEVMNNLADQDEQRNNPHQYYGVHPSDF